MIAHLKGELTEKAADRVVVDVGGVGYEVLIPYSTYYELVCISILMLRKMPSACMDFLQARRKGSSRN